jgi:hypothetical protein
MLTGCWESKSGQLEEKFLYRHTIADAQEGEETGCQWNAVPQEYEGSSGVNADLKTSENAEEILLFFGGGWVTKIRYCLAGKE